MRDLISNIKYYSMRDPAQAAVASTSKVVDRLGFGSILLLLVIGAITGTAGKVTIKLQESDESDADFTDVAGSDLSHPFTAIAANTNQTVQYRGGKRYLRLVTVHATSADKATFGAVALLSQAQQRPVT